MSTQAGRRRVLVVPDAGAFGRAAVEQAASLAARIDAELSALFLENADLFRLAMLPFALETGIASGLRRPLDMAALEAALRRDAQRVQAALAEAAARSGVAWSLHVRRGSLAREVLTAAASGDAVLLGWQPAAAAPAPRRRPEGRWLVWLPEAGEAGRQVLERVLPLATGACRELLVLAPAAAPGALAGLVPRRLAVGAPAVVVRSRAGGVAGLAAEARHARAELIILPGAAPEPERTLAALLARAPCPVLLLGEASAAAG